MNVNLIATDLDGTLMNSKNQITDNTINVLREASEKGILIVPATGRCVELIPRELLSAINIRYAIVANGAGIWDYKEKKFLFRKLMPEGVAAMILEEVSGKNGYVEVFCKGKSYVDIEEMKNLSENFRDQNFIKYYRQNHIFVSGLAGRKDILSQAEKINLFYLSPDVKENLEYKLRSDGRCAVTSSISGNIEIHNEGVNKGSTLKLLCSMLNICMEEVVSFGDSDNDMEMLQLAGVGVAMENACKKISNIANIQTNSNDENGVADYIRNCIL